jgi:hypothetical protein
VSPFERYVKGGVIRNCRTGQTRPFRRCGITSICLKTRRRAKRSVPRSKCTSIGLDASIYSGDSLKLGLLTSAAVKGTSIFKLMDDQVPT